MKLLKRIRLINWHRFTNETIELADSVLLSGENGAGKSTILDAIQLVITASKNNFNKAAHEKGKRTLNTYIRCKTGREDRPYERTGALSAHVALEFLDEGKNLYFVIGCAMDSATEEKEPNTAWYLMERCEFQDEMFFKGAQVRSISSFRSANSQKIRIFATTQRQAQAMILQRFGRLEEKFFTLIPKALAFKPISDIKDFVYSYVLDEKDVNIDALRENVRSYQDLSRLLAETKKKIAQLEEIAAKKSQVDNCIRIDQYQEYYLARVQQDILEAAIKDLQESFRSDEIRKKDYERQKAETARRIEANDDMITDLTAELKSNQDYQAYVDLERRQNALAQTLSQDKEAVAALEKEIRTALRDLEKLDKWQDITGVLDPCYQRYAALLKDIRKQESLLELRDTLDQVTGNKKTLYDQLTRQSAETDIAIASWEKQQQELLHIIHSLEEKKLSYRPEVTRLQESIAAQLSKSGREGDVRILCEQLEITDPDWQDAVEGYLNTQRFYLLVSPENFDLGASVYERLRRDKKAYGVGLINTGKLDEYEAAPEGSLAQKVSSRNIYARRYINMVLGKVHCCNRVEELRSFPVSITKGCMRYQNHVVSAIRPDIFRTPYIGARAAQIQLAQKRQEMEQLKAELSGCRDKKQRLLSALQLLDTTHDVEIKYHLQDLEKERADEKALAQIKKDLEAIGANRSLIEKQIRLQQLQEERNHLQNARDDLSSRIGSCSARMENTTLRIQSLQKEISDESALITELIDQLGASYQETENNYQKEKSRRPSLETFRSGFENARKANQTKKDQFIREMTELMHSYKVSYDFGAPAEYEGFSDFQNELTRLKDSKLLDYEDQVQKARTAAEEEFREQFLSKLQENIKQAQGEFRELNRSLRDIHFAHEQYEFLYSPRTSLQKYYSMIMDDFNVMQGESIFSGAFNTNHREVIEELFEKLSLDDENSQETLAEYTDYRTYMDYDIRITNDDGSYMYYSKVSREKSGGETQTPFYITIAASFMQLYRGSIGGDSIGLIMMDEAFNNMDDARIQGVLSFMKSANLQLVISCPPEKIQYIGPAMDKILLVMTQGNESYVEDFTHEAE